MGKSSLINAVCPHLSLRTKQVSQKSERGTHTTRHCEIISIDANSRIVDTPGFSQLKFDFLMPADVGLLFREIMQIQKNYGACKFSDCLHEHETGLKNRLHTALRKQKPARKQCIIEKLPKLAAKNAKYQDVKQIRI